MSLPFLSVSPRQLLSETRNITLIHIRPASTYTKLVTLPQANILEEEGCGPLVTLPEDTALAFICPRNIFSCGVAEGFAAHGFSNVHRVAEGIEAWRSA